MTTWATIDTRFQTFLDDEDETEYTSAQRIDGWNAAQRQLAIEHTPRERAQALSFNDDDRSIALPSDYISLLGLYDADNSRWWVRMPIVDGGYRADDTEERRYWTFGGTLYVERDMDDADDITLYYYAYWADIVDDDSVMAIPLWAELPCMHLASAFCLQPGAMQAADIRTWNISVDSGNPIQNSRATHAREHLFWWERILSKVTPVDRHGSR